MKDIFWDIWEMLCADYPQIADEYCENDDNKFQYFRNEIQGKSELETIELIVEILTKVNNQLKQSNNG